MLHGVFVSQSILMLMHICELSLLTTHLLVSAGLQAICAKQPWTDHFGSHSICAGAMGAYDRAIAYSAATIISSEQVPSMCSHTVHWVAQVPRAAL